MEKTARRNDGEAKREEERDRERERERERYRASSRGLFFWATSPIR